MTWARVFDLYLDVDRPLNPLLEGTSSTAKAEGIEWVQGDHFTVRLHFRRRGAAQTQSTAQGLPASSGLVMMGKESDAGAPSGDPVFSQTTWVETVSGDDTFYSGELDLNTTEMNDLFTAGASSVTCLVDVEVQDAANSRRYTLRFQATIRAQVYSNESDPTPATPSYPNPSEIVTKACGTLTLGSGVDTASVTGMGLASTPAQILLTLRKPSAGAANLGAPTVIDGTEDSDGFDIELPSATPSTGYKLDYLVIL